MLNSDEMAQLKRLDRAKILGGYYKPFVVKGLYQVAGGGKALKERLDEIFQEVDEAIENGSNFLVLSDRELQLHVGTDSVAAAHLRGAAPSASADTRAPRSPWSSRPAMCVKSTMSLC